MDRRDSWRGISISTHGTRKDHICLATAMVKEQLHSVNWEAKLYAFMQIIWITNMTNNISKIFWLSSNQHKTHKLEMQKAVMQNV